MPAAITILRDAADIYYFRFAWPFSRHAAIIAAMACH